MMPYLKIEHLQYPLTNNYNDGIFNQQYIVWSYLIVGYHDLHNVSKAYENFFNAITTLVEPTPPTNIITNENILTQYSIRQGLNVLGRKEEASVKKYLQQFHNRIFVDSKKPQGFSYEQQRKILAYLMFLKTNNYEVAVKVRGCTNVKKQSNWLSK